MIPAPTQLGNSMGKPGNTPPTGSVAPTNSDASGLNTPA